MPEDLTKSWRESQPWAGTPTIQPTPNPDWTPSWADVSRASSSRIRSNKNDLIFIADFDKLRSKIVALGSETSSKVLVSAILAAAEVYRKTIESKLPSRRARVIIVERQRRGLVRESERSFLVGIEKKSGYYLYWKEHGHEAATKGRQWVSKKRNIRVKGGRGIPGSPGKQQARPFFDSAVNSAVTPALNAAAKIIADSLAAMWGK